MSRQNIIFLLDNFSEYMIRQKTKTIPKLLLISLGFPTIFFPGLILASILGWDWQKDLTGLATKGGYKQSSIVFPKTATVTTILDGDTFEIDNGQTVRMIGIDASNRGEAGREEATEYLKDIIEGETVGLEYDYYQDDKFGRILAYVWDKCKSALGCINGRRMANWLMVKKNYSKVVTYEDRRKLKYEEFLRSAESGH